jgi:hypothetical protein
MTLPLSGEFDMHRFDSELPFEPTTPTMSSVPGYVSGIYRGAQMAIRATPVLLCPDSAVLLRYRGVIYLADRYR